MRFAVFPKLDSECSGGWTLGLSIAGSIYATPGLGDMSDISFIGLGPEPGVQVGC